MEEEEGLNPPSLFDQAKEALSRVLDCSNLSGAPDFALQLLLEGAKEAGNVNDHTLEALFSSATIEDMDLSSVTQFSDTLLFRMPGFRCTSIESLSLSDCTQLHQMNESAMKLILNCRRLRNLDLSGSRDLLDTTMKSIVCMCQNLERILLSRCPKITGSFLLSRLSRCEGLLHVSFNDCPALEDSNLQQLFHQGMSLLSLDIGNCPQIGQLTFDDISLHCQDLKSLVLDSTQVHTVISACHSLTAAPFHLD